MNILSKYLAKIDAISAADKELLLKDAESLLSEGVTPIVAAQTAVKFAGDEIEDIYQNLLSATGDKQPSAAEPLKAYWSGLDLKLNSLPASCLDLAEKMAEAGIRTEEEISEILVNSSQSWAGPIAEWIAKTYPKTLES